MSTLPQVILKPRRALPFFSRHPWVFQGAIQRIDGVEDGTLQAGTEVELRSNKNEFIARGLMNPNSNIRVRLYSWDEAVAVDESLIASRLDNALAHRERIGLSAGQQTGRRVVFSEADGLSGLTVDQYGDWLLVQFTSAALQTLSEGIIQWLQDRLKPRGVWLRTERGIGESEGLELRDGLVAGEEPPRPIFIEEHGLRFGVDVTAGQKTGWYLDQRDNRAAVAHQATGRLLDVFCYTGGFGIAAAARGCVKSVQAVDASETAIQTARANAEMNGVASTCQFEKQDAFRALDDLAAADERFDTVILDPPKMARHRSGLKKAARGYFNLNRRAVELLTPGGLLVTCSCSGLMPREDFTQIIASVSQETGRRIRMIESRSQAADHPVDVNCVETDYLKCLICRVS